MVSPFQGSPKCAVFVGWGLYLGWLGGRALTEIMKGV